MLAGLGDGQAHGHLGEAAVVIAELDLLTDGEASLVLVVQSVLILGSGRIPLQDAGDLTGDPLVGLVSGGRTVVAVVGGQRHDDVVVHQALDEVQALGDLVGGVVQGGGGGVSPVLAVDGLQIEDHHDHAVVAAQVQGIVVIAQLALEGSAGGHQVVQGLGHLGDAGLVEGGHVPVEDTASHRNGDGLQHIGDHAGVQDGLIPLGQVDVIGHAVQVDEGLAVAGVVVQPVPVDLADILGHAAGELGGHGVLPAGPCGEGGVDGDVGVGLAESGDGFLVGLVAGLAAPPADAQLDGVARGSGNRSGSRIGSCSRRAAAAAAGSQQAGCAYSTGDLQEVTTGNCVAHFFSS